VLLTGGSDDGMCARRRSRRRLDDAGLGVGARYGCTLAGGLPIGRTRAEFWPDGESKAWSRSRLEWAGDGARELLPWTAGPGAQKNLDPEHPLARDSKGRSLALVLYLIQFVSCRPPSHYVSRTHCRSPAVSHVRTLACMFVNVEVVKGAKFLHEVLAARFLQTERFDPLLPPTSASGERAASEQWKLCIQANESLFSLCRSS